MAKQKKKPLKVKTAFTKEELERIFRSEKDEESFTYVPIFAVALSGQSSLYGDIDRLYEENEYEYHLIYNESPYKDIYTLHSLNLEAEFYHL